MIRQSDLSDENLGNEIRAWYSALHPEMPDSAVRQVTAVMRARRVRHARPWLRVAAGFIVFVTGIQVGRAFPDGLPARLRGQPVVFVFRAPAARHVSLVGDFNAWDAHATELSRDGDGKWTTTIRLSPGMHGYAFVIDGERWVIDPLSLHSVDGDFDSPTSAVLVSKEQRS